MKFSLIDEGSEKSLLGIEMAPTRHSINKATVMKSGVKIDINVMHERLGHASEEIVRQICKESKWHVTGTFGTCEACALGKAKQKNVPKETFEDKDKFYFDISTIKGGESYGGSKHWLLIVHGTTKMKWSLFLKNKDNLKDKMLIWVDEIRTSGQVIKSMRCNNAGENLMFIRAAKQLQLKIKFELTSPNTPQQNGIVERSFPTIAGKARAIFSSAGLYKNLRTKLWAEAVNTATKLDTLSTLEGKSSYETFYGVKPKFFNHLRIFGEIGIISNRKIMPDKLSDRGQIGMMVGYSDDHAGNVYCMWMLQTKRIVHTRDIIWLKVLYKAYMHLSKDEQERMSINQIDYDEEENTLPDEDVNNTNNNNNIQQLDEDNDPPIRENNEDPTQCVVIPRVKGLNRELRNLNTFYNVLEQVDVAMAMSVINESNNQPTFAEAMKRSDKQRWLDAIDKEFDNFKKLKVWTPIKLCKVPKGKTLVDSRWVMRVKNDGSRCAQLVARGFVQIPGVDFTELFSPVVNDITMRVIMVIWMLHSYHNSMIDVVAAFLRGILEEPVYLKHPDGMNLPDDKCLELHKAMYGLVPAALQFWKLFGKMMVELKFMQSNADPCL